MNGSGPSVRGWLSTLAKLLPDVPLGLHWHNSPFDVNYPEMFPRARLENLDSFLYSELVGALIPVDEVPMVDVKWEYKDVGEFKAPAIMSSVWLNDKGERRAFIVNISGEERQFEFKFTPNGETHSATLPPRSVKVCAE